MINLTHEEAQQVLGALKETWYHVGTFAPTEQAVYSYDKAIELLRAKLSEPEPEPVAWLNKLGNGAWIADVLKCEGDEPSEPLYTAPPQREWQGLTEEEMAAAWSKSKGDVLQRLKPFARAVEQALKEKNA